MLFTLAPVHHVALAGNAAEARRLFADPPREYSTAPLWVWNDDLTEDQVVETLQDLAGQRVRQVFVHPRPGLMTPYLSEKWFALWKAALREAERLDMNVWIYDENSYPSGFAGGFVPEAMPEGRGKGLSFRDAEEVPQWQGNMVAVYAVADNEYRNISDELKDGKPLPKGRHLVVELKLASREPWHGGRFYVDLLHPGLTQKFLEVTLDAYRREIGEHFGKRVPGSFTDEPQIQPAGGMPWTPDLPEQFEKRRGYKLLDRLPSLARETGDFRRVRHDYFRTLNELFIERWAKPYSEYCEENNLEFTGHYWEHDWPLCLRVPDNMAMYAWHQRPAIDTLMNQYSEDHHAQFGNVRAVKELSSVASQMGRARTLCEAYGAGGWDLRFEDMKRIADWLYVLGVNTLDEHLSFITIRGARKRDHPQSFSYHEPWWNDYHVVADYITRLSAAMSQGREVNPILVIEPTTTAWMYNTESGDHPKLKDIGSSFQGLVTDLSKRQVEYDIGSEDLIARFGSVQGKSLAIGRRSYDTVLIPPVTENLQSKTLELLTGMAKAGGTVLACSCAELPGRLDGRESDQIRTAGSDAKWQRANIGEMLSRLETRTAAAVNDNPLRRLSVLVAPGNTGILFHHRRQLEDGQLLLMVNTSIDQSASGRISATARGIDRWDLLTGQASPYPCVVTDEGVAASFELPPAGSLLLFLSDREAAKPVPTTQSRPASEQVVEPAGGMTIQRAEMNVLPLDYVDLAVGGETRKDLYVLKAADFVFRKHGMERNPWDRAVQFKNELMNKPFPEDSGFEATYKFTIEGAVPGWLAAVIERPDLYSITCNGKPVSEDHGWWLDKAFGALNIQAVARTGENLLTIRAKPFTMFHELEAAYILGEFSLKPVDKGFVIVPEQPLQLGPWNHQGHPFYAAGVTYRRTYRLNHPTGRHVVSLPAWYGSVARVSVNGIPTGHIWHQPWECDVSEDLREGENLIEVTVIGTLKNTLGPHHGNPPLGLAWPGMWDNAPEQGPPAGTGYATVSYGLFEPFVLRHTGP